jgi:hypothetical protein
VIDRLGFTLQLDPHCRLGSFHVALYFFIYRVHIVVDMRAISVVPKVALRSDHSPANVVEAGIADRTH